MFFKPPPHVGSSSTAPVLVHEGHPSSHVPHRGGVEEDPGVYSVPHPGGEEEDPAVDPEVAGEPVEKKMKAFCSNMLDLETQ